MAAPGPAVPTMQVAGDTPLRGHALEGSVQPVRQATVSAQVGGAVLALLVRPGDRLRAGQAIARIDERDTQAGLQRGNAELAQAEANWRQARSDAQRSRELHQQGYISQAALDQAETRLQAAQAGAQAARAGREQVALARSHATVTAPFDAVVQATHLEAGDLAAPGRPIATVYQPGALRAVVQVPLSMADAARGAHAPQVALPDGRTLTPTAMALLPAADAVSQTLEWRLELPAGTVATPGQAARVNWQASALPLAGASAAAAAARMPLRIPSEALLRRGELTAVYVAHEGRFVLRAVRTGAERGAGGVEVLAGLTAGERIARDAVRAGLAGARPAAQ